MSSMTRWLTFHVRSRMGGQATRKQDMVSRGMRITWWDVSGTRSRASFCRCAKVRVSSYWRADTAGPGLGGGGREGVFPYLW